MLLDKFIKGVGFLKRRADRIETFYENLKRFLIPDLWFFMGKSNGSSSFLQRYKIYIDFRRRMVGAKEKFLKNKKSDTLAILGSGSSINEISDEEFLFIRNIDSLGLGFWCYHNFVPDFYMFEGVTGRSRWAWLKLIIDKAQDYKNTLFLCNIHGVYKNGSCSEFFLNLPSFLRENIYPMKIYHLAVFKKSKFKNRGIEKGFRRISSPLGPYVGFRSCLSAALGFAYFMRYKKIILYGVDLLNSKYFWANYSWIEPHTRTCHGRNPKDKHSTVDGNIYKGIHEYIYYIEKEVFLPTGREIFVANKKSLLYPKIPLFNYREHFHRFNYEGIK